MTFSATPLGEALVSGCRAMGLANLWTPDLRGKIEAGISAVAAGQRTKVQKRKSAFLSPMRLESLAIAYPTAACGCLPGLNPAPLASQHPLCQLVYSRWLVGARCH